MNVKKIVLLVMVSIFSSHSMAHVGGHEMHVSLQHFLVEHGGSAFLLCAVLCVGFFIRSAVK